MKKFIIGTWGILFLLYGSLAHAERPAYESRFGLMTVGGFVVFFNSKGPLSYQTLTPGDLPQTAVRVGEVKGRSCQYAVSIPVIFSGGGQRTSISAAKGDGSYRKAFENIKVKNPDLDGVFDVKIDLHRFNILGIYKRDCTEIFGQGFRIPFSPQEKEIEEDSE